MSKFKVGDRVQTIPDRNSYTFSGKIKEGIIVAIDRVPNSIHVNIDGKNPDGLNFDHDAIELITENPMYTNEQIRDALKSSVTHWQEIVGVFAGAKVDDRLRESNIGTSSCALCMLFDSIGKSRCDPCPLGSCNKNDSLWDGVYRATTNHAAWEASKAMLARLEELLEEYEGKAKDAENDIRVGDFVYHIDPLDPSEFLRNEDRCGVIRSDISVEGEYHWVDRLGRHWLSYPRKLILIHRPAAKGK